MNTHFRFQLMRHAIRTASEVKLEFQEYSDWHDSRLWVNLINQIRTLGQWATHTHKHEHVRATEISTRTTKINFKSQCELENQISISNLKVNFKR